jgi:hypothetical protein
MRPVLENDEFMLDFDIHPCWQREGVETPIIESGQRTACIARIIMREMPMALLGRT